MPMNKPENWHGFVSGSRSMFSFMSDATSVAVGKTRAVNAPYTCCVSALSVSVFLSSFLLLSPAFSFSLFLSIPQGSLSPSLSHSLSFFSFLCLSVSRSVLVSCSFFLKVLCLLTHPLSLCLFLHLSVSISAAAAIFSQAVSWANMTSRLFFQCFLFVITVKVNHHTELHVFSQSWCCPGKMDNVPWVSSLG